jgi:4-diphosphocytidyl-2-C-methyl-D-erythritol kinase
MHIEPQADRVEVRAPAKVNLFLEVLGKRPDGYHDIASLMLAVSLFDTLAFEEESNGLIELHCDLPRLSTGPDNLVHRAATLLRQKTGTNRGARIELTKRIPLGGGLAGGSSDAAATLAGLNVLWKLGLSNPELTDLAAQIGSDVAFFFTPGAAWCTGRGEIVTPQQMGKPLDLLLIGPGVEVSTAAVYRQVKVPATPVNGDEIRQAVAAGSVEEIGRLLFNRLQPAAEKIAPEIAGWHSRLAALKPAGVLMSGSGSTVFALCRNRREALRMIRELRKEAHEGPSDSLTKMFLVRSHD